MLPSIEAIREHIQHDILNDPQQMISDERDLLLSGLLDSLSVIRLVAWLEAQCGFTIPAEDVLVEHFGSLLQIQAFLQKRTT